ncbi:MULTISPECIES: hypothetical protein [Sinorhizobium]|uniref:hypothetical protein n=1 Tax=Sinorhizobium TaxID=28105 RepID=UPI000BE9A77A|nr:MULTISPECIES: hypothetical protein [Sinorhizobium]PDT39805.1 hypothetical protein CO656_19265 [Sinorhizobium sp. FG01]
MPRTGGVYSPPAGTKGVSNTTIQSVPYNAFVDDLTADANAARPVTAGGTGSTTASGARTALGLAIGSDVQAYDAGLASIAGLTTSADKMIYTTASDTYATTALTSFARTILDDADAAAVRTTIGAQASDAGLTSIAGLTTSANQMIYTTASDTYATASLTAFARTVLDDADATTARATLGVTIGTNVQAYDAALAAISGLAFTDGGFIVGNGTTYVIESGSTARTSLGLGSIATQNASAVAITGGSVTGITDLAIADGGTGASTASTARTNLGLGGLAVLDTTDLVYTGSSAANLTFPIGTTIVVSYGAAPDRNEAMTFYLFASNTQQYSTTVNGTAVGGTWRARGLAGSNVALMQRVA